MTNRFAKLRPERIGIALLIVVSAILGGAGAWALVESNTTKAVVIAAGPTRAESYVLLTALKNVVERHYPNIKVAVQETVDTSENLRRLEKNNAQFAASQADGNAGPSARIVAVLFEDTFQLLVHNESNIKQFTDLKGKKVALAPRGAQYQTFLFLASHFGLKDSDFQFLGQDDETADVSFARKDADAIFRVRALNNASVERTAHTANVSFIPIEDAQAMHIRMPAYAPTTIPKGTYLGNPPVPATDIQTVAQQHTLLVRQDVDDDVVEAITQVLMERRPELGAIIARSDPSVLPLLSQIRQPLATMGFGLGVHPGAMNYYQHGKPPFIQTHADLVALAVAVILLLGCWVWALKVAIHHHHRDRVDRYIHATTEMMGEIEITNADRALTPVRRELWGIFNRAVEDLQKDGIDEVAFQSFYVIWQVAYDSLRERRVLLRTRHAVEPVKAEPVAQPDEATAIAPFSFTRFLK